MQSKCDVVLISVNSPILLGIYEDSRLVESFALEGKTSEILPRLFGEILERRAIGRVFYANGPGNFSALKLTHIFLQTLQIAANIELFCADSFSFTRDSHINAYGKIHFFKENGEIKTTHLEESFEARFALPNVLNPVIFDAQDSEDSQDSPPQCAPKNAAIFFSKNCLPLYVLPPL